MVNPYMFREYDIRGIADEDFSDDVVYLLGRTLGTYFLQNNVNKITLGRDCRLSSPRIHKGLSQGVLDTGCNIVDLGIIPSPLLYFSLFQLDMNGGLMITGSHNPPDNNGLKVCLGKGTIHGREIQGIRRTVIEMILSTHPQECLTCARNQNCELQTLAAEFGIREIPYEMNVRRLPKDTSTPSIVLDPTKCIQCGRCAQVCQEVQGVWALEFLGRGENTRIAPAADVTLAESPCVKCGFPYSGVKFYSLSGTTNSG